MECPLDTLELFSRGISETGTRFQKEQYLISSVAQLKNVPSDLIASGVEATTAQTFLMRQALG